MPLQLKEVALQNFVLSPIFAIIDEWHSAFPSGQFTFGMLLSRCTPAAGRGAGGPGHRMHGDTERGGGG